MSQTGGLGAAVSDRRLNAAASWVLVGFLLLAAAGNLWNGDLLWAGFAAAVAVLALVPPAAFRDPRTTLPWEVVVLAALPVVGRTFATVELTSDLATYLSVAAVALIIAVELHTFTTVRMSTGFAVLFVAVATMATAGVWAVARWLADTWLGTRYLLDPALSDAEIHTGLMLEFTYSTAVGLLAGSIFEGYFRRYGRVRARARPDTAAELPDGIERAEPEQRAGGAGGTGRAEGAKGTEGTEQTETEARTDGTEPVDGEERVEPEGGGDD